MGAARIEARPPRDFKSRHVADEWPDETPRDFARQSLGKSGDPALIHPSLLPLSRHPPCFALLRSSPPCISLRYLVRAAVTFNRTRIVPRLNFSLLVAACGRRERHAFGKIRWVCHVLRCKLFCDIYFAFC